MKCRHCFAPLTHPFIDLGFAPPSNAYLTAADLGRPEKYFPLRVMICDKCWLAQTEDCATADELFSAEYAYFSSTSAGWLAHAKTYSEKMIRELPLTPASLVIEIASNDGYLLKNFIAAGIGSLGIEPTASTASAATQLGIPVINEFFSESLGRRLASEGRHADLIVGNNVYAHVPDINSFTRGLRAALKPGGTITLEFPHLMQLIDYCQFDTVYHEHFSYLSLFTTVNTFAATELRIFDVEQLPTHGGSLRVYGCHSDDPRAISAKVAALIDEEGKHGLRTLATYRAFQPRADGLKDDLLRFLLEQKAAGKSVAAYGAAAKGNTLLNYAGVKPDLLGFVCDAAPAKQGKFMPGSHIPIRAPEALEVSRPDFLLILPWNIADEVKAKCAHLAAQGTRFVTAVPKLEVT